jgi:mono/diheme cytochrome c family protein
MKVLKILVILFILTIVAGFLFIYWGIYNVSALKQHTRFTHWIITTAMERSVRYHARGIQVPPLSDPALLELGFQHYTEMCEGCHASPGVQPSEMVKGLNPQPPVLTETVKEWSPAELYWIIKNGIRMTGMPAWGSTHSDEELWAMVAHVMSFSKPSSVIHKEESRKGVDGEQPALEQKHEHKHEHQH